MRRLAPGLEGVAADIYWLRTVHYFGEQRLFASSRDFSLLKPLIDITVTLDKRMEIAYRYGAIFLAEPPPLGAGRPLDALELLERGTRAMPDNWHLQQDLGFYHFLFLKDAQTAARILVGASKIKGAPIWLKTLAADVLAKGRDRKTALLMWKEIYNQSEGGMKSNALIQILMVEAMDQADELTSLVRRFTERLGRRPTSLEELRSAGLLKRPAEDSIGVPFEYERETGTVSVSKASRLWRPTE